MAGIKEFTFGISKVSGILVKTDAEISIIQQQLFEVCGESRKFL